MSQFCSPVKVVSLLLTVLRSLVLNQCYSYPKDVLAFLKVPRVEDIISCVLYSSLLPNCQSLASMPKTVYLKFKSVAHSLTYKFL